MDAELPEKTTADIIGHMDVCADPEGNPQVRQWQNAGVLWTAQSNTTHKELIQRSQAELVLKWFGAEPYQAFCQGERDEIERSTTKQERAAEKPRQEKGKASASKTGSNVAVTAPGSEGTNRLESNVQVQTPSHQGRGMCRTQ